MRCTLGRNGETRSNLMVDPRWRVLKNQRTENSQLVPAKDRTTGRRRGFRSGWQVGTSMGWMLGIAVTVSSLSLKPLHAMRWEGYQPPDTSSVGAEPAKVGIEEAVGKGAANRREDVSTIQSLLNQVPTPVGGPSVPLEVDGQYGPKTESALLRFLRIQFGRDESILEPKSKGLERLSAFQDWETLVREGEPVAWGKLVSPAFKRKMLEVAAKHEIDPNYLMAAMAFETGETFSPAIKNPKSTATGLIQFMATTARSLGTTTEALAQMSDVEQLDYVDRYMASYTKKLKSIEDVYMAILWPAAIGKPNDDVLFNREKQPGPYAGNRGLDRDGDGSVTKEEAAAPVREKLKRGLSDWAG